MPDQELIDQCRKLYAKHKDALDLIFRYGEVNTFESAATQFFGTHPELKLLANRTSVAAFLPGSLYEVTPELEGTNWWGQSRPILYWFYHRKDRLGLILEVGPLSGTKLPREILVKQFLDHFGSNTKITAKFTRIYSEHRKLTNDQISDPEELVVAMNALYETVVVNHLPAIIEITRLVFQQ